MARSKSPFLCVRLLYPRQYGRPELGRYFGPEERQALRGFESAVEDVILDALTRSQPEVVSDESVAAVAMDIISTLSQDAEYLNPENLQTAEEYRRSCDVGIQLYEMILEADNAPAVLRYVVSPE